MGCGPLSGNLHAWCALLNSLLADRCAPAPCAPARCALSTMTHQCTLVVLLNPQNEEKQPTHLERCTADTVSDIVLPWTGLDDAPPVVVGTRPSVAVGKLGPLDATGNNSQGDGVALFLLGFVQQGYPKRPCGPSATQYYKCVEATSGTNAGSGMRGSRGEQKQKHWGGGCQHEQAAVSSILGTDGLERTAGMQ